MIVRNLSRGKQLIQRLSVKQKFGETVMVERVQSSKSSDPKVTKVNLKTATVNGLLN